LRFAPPPLSAASRYVPLEDSPSPVVDRQAQNLALPARLPEETSVLTRPAPLSASPPASESFPLPEIAPAEEVSKQDAWKADDRATPDPTEQTVLSSPSLSGAMPHSPFGSVMAASEPDRQLAAVEGRASAMVAHAFSLAERGAMFTARTELLQALRMIVVALDAAEQTNVHEESLTAALRALEEGADFQPHGAHLTAAPDLEKLVVAHRTPVLKNADLQQVTTLQAIQLYYTFAQERLAAAAGHRPAASLTLYGLGKLHMALAAQTPAAATLEGPKAMVFHQAAMLVDPQNHLAANELGVLLTRYGQWEDAKRVLLHSLAVCAMPQTWHNLAAIHEHLGETELAGQARFELKQWAQKDPQSYASLHGPQVRWLTPEEFAATGESGAPKPIAAEDPVRMTHSERPSDLQWWKPWTWF
jgi:hypothetical protein